jgi:hypothetical protein
MRLVDRDPSDRTLITHMGGAEIGVRPEQPSEPGRAPVVLLRLVSPMFDTLAVAYLGPTEAVALARMLDAAAEAVGGGAAHGWRTPPPAGGA